MPYPLTDQAAWQPERTTPLWLTFETTHPDPDQGMIVEMAATVTGWDLTPRAWIHYLVRPVVLNWSDVARAERAALYAQNGLTHDIGRHETVDAGTRGENIVTVIIKLSKWWYQTTGIDQIPVICGPHAALTLDWLTRWGDTFGRDCHPVAWDTFGLWEYLAHHAGFPDPCPDEPYGRAVPDVYRNLAVARAVAGLAPVPYPDQFDQVRWSRKDPHTW